MKKSALILTVLILSSLVAVALLQDDQPQTLESISTKQENATESNSQNTPPSSNVNFLKSTWSKFRVSVSAFSKPSPSEATAQMNSDQKNNSSSSDSTSNTETDFSTNRNPLTNSEIRSVQSITKSLSRAIAQNLTSHQYMQMLKDSLQLRPQFLDEGTSSIGSLVTVRTFDALEGTRYLHAQFTGEQNKADFLQHASFQIRASPDSFNKAVEALNQVLPKNKTIKESSGDYILYNTGDGYVAWVKVADLDDLKSNDYNQASPKDVGTVIVTIEQEIHGDDEHKH